MSLFRRWLRLGGCWAGLVLLTAAAAQEPATTISVQVKVVNVLATVRDKHNHIVNNLSQDDFLLEEDGRPQAIRYFTRETDLPLTLGMLVDTSLSQVRIIDQERSATATFADEVLRENKDSAFLIHFDREVELLQDLTSARGKLVSALDQLQAPAYDRQSGGSRGAGYPGGGGRDPSDPRPRGFGGGTLLYDAVYLASDELMQKQKGRKAIIVLTDGVDHGSKMSLGSAIESAQRADTMVYSIYYEGQEAGDRHLGVGGPWGGGGGGRHGGGWPGGGGGWPGGGRSGGGPNSPSPQRETSADGKRVLEQLSRETGGRMFAVSKKEPIDQIYRQIEDELRNQYNLGYTSDQAADSHEYRRIRLSAKNRDLTVQAREGYYASRPMENDPDK